MTSRHSPKSLPAPPSDGKDLKVSFEFFPPKTEKMAENCGSRFNDWSAFSPRFDLRHLWGGGSTRELHPQHSKPDQHRDFTVGGGAPDLRRSYPGGSQRSR